MRDITTLVGRAAQYLDEWYPGWAEKLRDVKYDISNCGNCVLHHVDGSYTRALDLYKQRVSSDNWMNGNFPFSAIGLDKKSTHAAWDAEIAKRLQANEDTLMATDFPDAEVVSWEAPEGLVEVAQSRERELVTA